MSDHRGTANLRDAKWQVTFDGVAVTDEAKDPQELQERLDSIAYLLDRADRCQVWEPKPVDVREARQWIRRALIVANGATEREMWEAEAATRQEVES